jgi:protein-S-isoprenylcysteine O-methyltransferase Ste14
MVEPPDRPAIRVSPPGLLVGLLLIGALLHYFAWSVALLSPLAARVTGIALVIGSRVFAQYARHAFRRVHTNVLPTQPTTALATDGPYRYTRNPIYLSHLVLYAGAALLVNGAAPLLLLPLLAVGLHWGVVRPEEEYLQRKFGQAYSTYCAKVPRWF